MVSKLQQSIIDAIQNYSFSNPTQLADWLEKDRANVSKAIKRLIEDEKLKLNPAEYEVL